MLLEVSFPSRWHVLLCDTGKLLCLHNGGRGDIGRLRAHCTRHACYNFRESKKQTSKCKWDLYWPKRKFISWKKGLVAEKRESWSICPFLPQARQYLVVIVIYLHRFLVVFAIHTPYNIVYLLHTVDIKSECFGTVVRTFSSYFVLSSYTLFVQWKVLYTSTAIYVLHAR